MGSLRFPYAVGQNTDTECATGGFVQYERVRQTVEQNLGISEIRSNSRDRKLYGLPTTFHQRLANLEFLHPNGT